MNHIIKVFKGSLVGLGSILPGISGSMVATILKIYTELITALNQFTQKPIKAILSVWQYIVGVLLGYLIGFFLIKIFLENFPIPFTLLFIGFIIGSIPSVTPELKNKPKAWHHFLVCSRDKCSSSRVDLLFSCIYDWVHNSSFTDHTWSFSSNSFDGVRLFQFTHLISR